jgi:hypothetical protein
MEARYADLGTMAGILKDQRARRIDLVMRGHQIQAMGNKIVIPSGTTVMDESGVTDAGGSYEMTRTAVEGFAEKLKIDLRYLRRLYSDRPDLFAENLNALLHGQLSSVDHELAWAGIPVADRPEGWDEPGYKPDQRKLMLRLFRGDTTDDGVMRALVSSKFFAVDNLDVLLAALRGLDEAGLKGDGVHIDGCDLTEKNMYVRIVAPQIQAMAPTLLQGYRNPFGDGGMVRGGHLGSDVDRIRALAQREGLGYPAGQEPVMFAGIVIKNSETGDGRISITPRIVAQICANGYTITADAYARNHLGVDKGVGSVSYSADTQRKALELVALQARDAVAKFLAPEYLTEAVAQMEADAGAPIGKATETIKAVMAESMFSDEIAAEILNAFVAGGMNTAGGVANAATAVAQTVADPALAASLEDEAAELMRRAAQYARS